MNLGAIASARRRTSGGGGGGGISVSATAWKNVSTATSTSVTASPTAGNTLIVSVVSYQGAHANHAVTDNIGGSTGWTKITGQDMGTGSSLSLWVKFSLPSGVTSITCTGGTGAIISQGIIHEVSNVTAFTTGEFSSGTFTTGTANPVTGSLTNATANSVYFSALAIEENGNPATASINGTGSVGTWALANSTNSQELDGNDYVTVSMPYIIVSSSSSRAHGWTCDTSQGAGVTAILCIH